MIEPLLSDEAFLADVESASRFQPPPYPSPGVPEEGTRHRAPLNIWWLGQSGYLLQHNATRILLDPYLSDSLTRKYADTGNPHVRISRRVVDPKLLRGISIITSTHGHTDHLDAETLAAIRENNPDAMLIAPTAIQSLVAQRFSGRARSIDAFESCSIGDIEFRAVPASHPTLDRDEQARHKYLGFILRVGQFTIYHSGDTIVFPDMDQMLIEQSQGKIDLAILPINGKVGNMNGADAARLAETIGAKLVIPCHYDLFEFNTADPLEQFVPECTRIGQPYRILQLGERLTLSR
jgi:L-ascorbate metabolism protein UlaG (beta-lactamase superfamily)